MTYYPAFLDLSERLVLLVGAGQVAARKLSALLEAGARVRLVAPELHPKTGKLLNDRVELLVRPFMDADLLGVSLVIAATDNEAVNQKVAHLAKDKGLFVNVIKSPELGDFQVPAALRRGSLTIAVSTGGASPAAARRLRKELSESYGPEWEPYLLLLSRLRKRITEKGLSAEKNRPLFYRLVESDLLTLVKKRSAPEVDVLLNDILGPGFSLADLELADLFN
ncbi:precorrin-2 dehydrogenase/sirohydrochlorin ferrochelatase family protein [Dethiosulfatarculus sandiegensis]|uniref:precorrin-2 dehydrogenase n=1 Tax=Dethiosulfatarculus sandiegensis TaxID=1429043 RepID=A0A0D2HZZ7_9BACT|nr:bifunctional precorrin-2 dehydrogenase/sirohydrochlorin ferrochelatase [Dethiosulfatarculus sandiegensis]KIX15868.1 siroheme synthase [Dethiosulfatarculus sandiegensis]